MIYRYRYIKHEDNDMARRKNPLVPGEKLHELLYDARYFGSDAMKITTKLLGVGQGTYYNWTSRGMPAQQFELLGFKLAQR